MSLSFPSQDLKGGAGERAVGCLGTGGGRTASPEAAVEVGLEDSMGGGPAEVGEGWAARARRGAVQTNWGGWTSGMLEPSKLLKAQLFHWKACEGIRDRETCRVGLLAILYPVHQAEQPQREGTGRFP